MELNVLSRPALQTSLLELPWEVPLADWPGSLLVALPRGISRHVVRFVSLDGQVLALKEINEGLARHEYRLLRELQSSGAPSVVPAGIVTGRATRADEPLESILVTEHLTWSLPYRSVFGSRRPQEATAARLLDALVALIARLHLLGFAWNDCSLSNTLFRRDAGAFSAYLVDAETGELHARLSDGQREYDLDTASMNIAGELLDLEAGGQLTEPIDPAEVAIEIERRYRGLWHELTAEEEYDLSERWQVHHRIERLNALGFDIDEMSLVADTHGNRLRIRPKVVGAGHHARRLMRLTGLDVQENQARRMLNDLDTYRMTTGQRDRPEAQVARRWMDECYQPVLDAVPGELRNKLTEAELFHEVLEHRWYLAEDRGHPVTTEEATQAYVAEVLGTRTSEQAVVPSEG